MDPTKVWSDPAARAHSEWEAAQRAIAASQGGVDQEAALQVVSALALEKKRKQDDAQVARQSAAKAQLQKRARRTFTLQDGQASRRPQPQRSDFKLLGHTNLPPSAPSADSLSATMGHAWHRGRHAPDAGRTILAYGAPR